jgi:hypothetical protein
LGEGIGAHMQAEERHLLALQDFEDEAVQRLEEVSM